MKQLRKENPAYPFLLDGTKEMAIALNTTLRQLQDEDRKYIVGYVLLNGICNHCFENDLRVRSCYCTQDD